MENEILTSLGPSSSLTSARLNQQILTCSKASALNGVFPTFPLPRTKLKLLSGTHSGLLLMAVKTQNIKRYRVFWQFQTKVCTTLARGLGGLSLSTRQGAARPIAAFWLLSAFLYSASGAFSQGQTNWGDGAGTMVDPVQPQGAAPSGWAASGETPRSSAGIDPQQARAGALTPDYVAKFSPDFWKGASNLATYSSANNFLESGVILTGTLEDDLSSKKNKKGDVFSIVLADGYSQAGRQILPAGSKIVGVIVAAIPAKVMQHGIPGRLEISLQTFVLADGRSTPIFAFIERNPNLDIKHDPEKVSKAPPFAGYASSLKGSAFALVNSVGRRGLGMNVYNPVRPGQDFQMDKGEQLPIRLNRRLELGALLQQPIPQGTADAGFQQQQQEPSNRAPASVPGLVGPDYQYQQDAQKSIAPQFPDVNHAGNGAQAQTNGNGQIQIPDPF
jgi:hypothetical protein